MKSVTLATMTSRSPTSSRTSATFGYRTSRITTTSMPASFSWWDSSRSVYSGLFPTTTAPIRRQA